MNDKYIVATIRPWNIKIFNDKIKKFPGKWVLITNPEELKIERIKSINPRYIFFPHWNKKVPSQIFNFTDCVCFHETDLPYGRGGSPIQNLIERGHNKTKITALKMIDKLDAGPVYMKKHLSLKGSAIDIYHRSAKIIANMIKHIINFQPNPVMQTGVPTYFRRRNEKQSEIVIQNSTLESLYNHIRMLDAPEYPKAFINIGRLKIELCNPKKKINKLTANVVITENKHFHSNDHETN